MYELFESIAKVGSPAGKLQLLKEYPYQEQLKTTLKMAADPFITFGITDFEVDVPYSGESPYYVLRQLANRELTGGAARFALGASCADLGPEDQEVIRRVIRKDLRCGVGEKLILQLYPELLQQFSVMRAEKFKTLSTRGFHYIEPKYDGLRGVAVVRGKSVGLFSRNGKEFTSSDHLKEQILRLAPGNGVFDGELTSGNFNSSSSAVRRKSQQNTNTNFNIFEWLDEDEWKSPSKPYHHRRAGLMNLFQSLEDRTNEDTIPNLLLVPSYSITCDDDAFKYYGQFLDAGYEGGIVKDGKGLYRFRRHRDWMKLKEINEVDLVIESLVQGEGKYYGMLGAAIVKFNGKRVSVGSGWSDEERRMYWDDPNLILHKVMEVHYHQVTPDGSLRHPRKHLIRGDKSV